MVLSPRVGKSEPSSGTEPTGGRWEEAGTRCTTPIETPDRNHTHSSKDRGAGQCQESSGRSLPATTAKAQDCKARPPNSKLTRRPRTRHPAQRTQVQPGAKHCRYTSLQKQLPVPSSSTEEQRLQETGPRWRQVPGQQHHQSRPQGAGEESPRGQAACPTLCGATSGWGQGFKQ